MEYEFYKRILEQCTVAYSLRKVVFDKTGTPCDVIIAEANEAYFSLAKELKPVDTAVWLNKYGNLLKNSNEVLSEILFLSPLKWYRVTSWSPEESFVLTIYRDITKEKTDKDKVNVLLNLHTELLCITDTKANFVDVSRRLEEMLGYSQAELERHNLFDFIYSDDVKSILEIIETINIEDEIVNFSFRFLTKYDGYKRIKVRGFKKNHLFYAFAAEAKDNVLRDDSSIDIGLSLFFDNVSTQIWYLTDAYTYGKANKAHADFVGLSVSELENRSVLDVLKRDEAEDCIESNKKLFASGKKIITEEWRTNAKKEKRLLKIIKSPVFNKQGKIKYIICSAEDITENKAKEEQNLIKENILNAIVTFSRDTVDFESLSRTIPMSLELLGQTLNMDSAYYFQNKYDKSSEEWRTSQLYVWNRDCTEIKNNPPDYQNVAFSKFTEFVEPLSKGKPYGVNVKDLSEGVTKNHMVQNNVKSVIALPVFVKDVFWGFVGLHTCKQEKKWNETELTLLKNYIQVLSKTIERIELDRELENINRTLEKNVSEKTSIINDANIATIVALAKLAEVRDGSTGEHLERVSAVSKIIAEALRQDSYYNIIINDEFISSIKVASLLHDLGKIAIRDSILLKKGILTVEEYEEMKQHTIFGAESLKSVYKSYNNIYLKMAIDIALSHHEKWDGSGYPYGLVGDDIPLAAQIVAICDVYDALRSKRPYKEAFAEDIARRIILDGKNKHFNPAIVDVFIKSLPAINKIYETHQTSA
jgi:PAS domain S-box-containing protein